MDRDILPDMSASLRAALRRTCAMSVATTRAGAKARESGVTCLGGRRHTAWPGMVGLLGVALGVIASRARVDRPTPPRSRTSRCIPLSFFRRIRQRIDHAYGPQRQGELRGRGHASGNVTCRGDVLRHASFRYARCVSRPSGLFERGPLRRAKILRRYGDGARGREHGVRPPEPKTVT